MATLRLILLIVGIVVGSGWLIQRVELVYKGPYLAGAGGFPGAQVFLAIPLGVLGALAVSRRLLGRGDRAVLYMALVLGVFHLFCVPFLSPKSTARFQFGPVGGPPHPLRPQCEPRLRFS